MKHVKRLGIAALALIILVLFPLYGYLVWCNFDHDWSKAGVFGDAFGSLNALFSGVALLGAILAILLQSQELKEQRNEIRENRVEFKRQSEAQDGFRRALLLNAYAECLALEQENATHIYGRNSEAIRNSTPVIQGLRALLEKEVISRFPELDNQKAESGET